MGEMESAREAKQANGFFFNERRARRIVVIMSRKVLGARDV